MKKFYTIILGAVFSLAAISCVPEKQDTWTPGEAEDPFCYGVYFPVQAASGYHIYSPTDAPKAEITVARTNTSGAITVPVEATYSDEVFTASAIAFADGQAETTFTLSFPTIEQGKVYSASLTITDPTYASKYSSNAISFDFSVMQVKMEEFKNPKTGETAVFTLTEGWWGEVHTARMEFYEVDGVRTCTFISTEEGNGIWGDAVDATLRFIWYTKDNNGEGNNLVEVPKQYLGFDYDDWASKPVGEAGNPVFVYDLYWWHIERATSGIDQFTWMSFAKKYGDPDGSYPVGYYDGNGGFFFNMRYYIPGLGGWTPDLYDLVAISDGFVRVDYSLDIESDYPADGVTPIYVEAGADVKSVKYAIYEGALNSAQQEAKLTAIIAGNEENVVNFSDFTYDEDEAINYAVIGVSPEKTATYTLIMVACDAEDKVQNSASVIFNHINAEDNEDYAVSVSVFTEDTPARYTQLHKYDSFAYCVSGTDLTEAHIAIVDEATLAKYGTSIVDVIKADEDSAVDEDTLAEINADGGYYTIARGAAAKTTYYVIVWATNGSRENYDVATYTTDPLPYVWNSLGKGTITDGFLMPIFGEDDVTLPCDVYEEATTPGLYMVTGFQLSLVALFYGAEESELAPYEGSNWFNAEIVVDATDPEAVYIGEQDYGIYVNSKYGYVQIDSEPEGTLVDGVITFPAKKMYIGLTNYGWLYGNTNGTFAITLPSAVTGSVAPVAAVAPKNVDNAVLSSNAVKADRKVVYERDAQSIAVKSQTLTPARKEKTSSARTEAPVKENTKLIK